MKDIYVIYNIFKMTDNISIDNVAFNTKEEAVKYIEEKLNKEELEHNRKMQKRNLRNWYEFFSKNYIYYIKVVTLK